MHHSDEIKTELNTQKLQASPIPIKVGPYSRQHVYDGAGKTLQT